MNGEHLSCKTRELLDRPMEERIAYIQVDSWIPYSQANKILQQLEDLLNHPKCDRMPNLAISAQTNNGKTRLIKHFSSLHQASESSSEAITAPVFYVQCPGFPDESRLYNSILLKLCKKFRPSAPPQEKLVLTLDSLSKIELRILALDEVNFTEVGTAAKQKRFLNALRFLANELRISIVCLGTEEMMRVIRTSLPSRTDFCRRSFRPGSLIKNCESCLPRSKRSSRLSIRRICKVASSRRSS
jgi:hypothetical protein